MNNDDLISRSALKKALKSNCDTLCPDKNTNWCEHCCPLNDFEDLIDNAPTVVVDCKNCDGYEAGYSAGMRDTERPQGEIFSMEIVAGKCPIDANGDCPLRPKGKWIKEDDEHLKGWYRCSVCGRRVEDLTDDVVIHAGCEDYTIADIYPYCHCGADMRGGGTNE